MTVLGLTENSTEVIEASRIKELLDRFLEGQGKNRGRNPDERYASFDYCYSYFYTFYKENRLHELGDEKNLEMSCLQLGFYLASWGMLRGSSFLLEKSVRVYAELIRAISKMDARLWSIDVPDYTEENIALLMECRWQITTALGREVASDTLTTKIMLGVFANVPAFDQYFRKSLNVYTFNRKSLLKIKEFYNQNKDLFDSFKIQVFDFSTSRETKIVYTKAKLVDMCGFMGGQ